MKNFRRGFTLIELLVAMALTVFILSILAQAFVSGTDTFRTLKAVGDLNDSLRTVANILKNDLSADHFEGKRRLSDSRFWSEYKRIDPTVWPNPPNATSPVQTISYGAPLNGYFVAYQDPSIAPNLDGNDPDGLPVFCNANSALLMTIKAKGNRMQDFYTRKCRPGRLTTAPPMTAGTNNPAASTVNGSR